jgi:putative membrane protein
MMPYYGWGMGTAGWAWMGFMMLFWLAVLVALIVLGWRLMARHAEPTPLDTLKRRLARGEISSEQYEQDRHLLTS